MVGGLCEDDAGSDYFPLHFAVDLYSLALWFPTPRLSDAASRLLSGHRILPETPMILCVSFARTESLAHF